ncbi:uncharacterized protein LOC106080668 [Stomoxys calcitrans]|uniref:MADF domain-containing protein n=1 Tax=Stomoxys calcitrans TaxID=35570 RepID=A0A1I8NR66_STOCA|nr:uncharacterized protein LOC106080668 [Stomoxys calcitrans]XP_013097575.1 uncharacterized protein LOC106080668 [Stomoxys calcitrans]XP_013097577.1 uncharacterized protein LOC106080668 [Stomoxys calcitrans]
MELGITSREKRFWLQFIALYKTKPELWKVDSDVYRNKSMKQAAYDVLVEKCQEIEPYADKDYVVRKINSLRTSARKEFRKVQESIKYAECPEDEYVPSLYYYQSMKFLYDQEEQGDIDNTSADSEREEEMERKRKITSRTSKSPAVKRKKPKALEEEFMDLPLKGPPIYEDNSQMLANVWASEYRMLSESQKIFAKKAIDDVLFEAKLGTLHRNSVKINVKSPPSSSSPSWETANATNVISSQTYPYQDHEIIDQAANDDISED